MPRIERGLVDGFIYHVLNRGNAKQTVFHDKYNYRYFLDLLKDAKEKHPIKIFAYCLMPNHYHLIISPEKGNDLSIVLQWVMTSYVRYIHRTRGSSGHIWQGRYKNFIIKNDAHLITVLRYVENNPVRAQLVQSAEDWPWSSLAERFGNKKVLLDESPVELPTNWRDYVNKFLNDEEINRLRNSVKRQAPFGDSMWQSEICRELGLGSTISPRGRPKR
jgi:putative transposase